MTRPQKRTAAALVAALAVGVGAGAGGYAFTRGGDSPASATGAPAAATAATTTAPQPAAASTSTLSIKQIYANDNPGVVELTVTTGGSSGGNGAFPFGGGGGSSTAQGSGFVYDSSGDIVTNQHVVSGATSVKVKFPDGKTYSATVVGSDPSDDLAVVKVDAPSSELHPLALGDSSKVSVGDGVVAIGSPFGLENTLTAGIVSAVNRDIQSTNGFTIGGAIQTDAAINHGNSGGALIDMSGNVIGVTAQIESDSGDNAGVGFAIPSNTVKSVASQIIGGQQVKHAYLGVSVGDAASGGATIEQVQSGTPAADAGLKTGDVVTAVNGTSIPDSQTLTTVIGSHKPGDKVTLTYTRNGATQTATVTLGTRPSSS